GLGTRTSFQLTRPGQANSDVTYSCSRPKGLPVWMCVVGEGQGTQEVMNTVRLVSWYKRYGFEKADELAQRRFDMDRCRNEEMVRYPNGWVPSLTEF
ncbi:hypothetical protein, partial [Mycobacteroides abscessus]|uniref:hypothetical protein n=1 Tax=Mycobacteroides abscessus TaxID=36809 RepID=UPI0013FDC773